MFSVNCKQCGFANLAAATTCKQCGAPLVSNEQRLDNSVSGSQPLVTEDGYVLPPPPSVGLYPSTSGIWRDKTILVMGRQASLPDRCVKCNEPAHGFRLKRRMTWHHPALYILIFVAFLIYLIVALIVRQTATVEIGLCAIHLAKRRRDLIVTWVLILLGVVMIFVSLTANEGIYALIGLVIFLVGVVYGITTTRIVAPAKIDSRFVWLKGFNKDYLQNLPAWVGQ